METIVYVLLTTIPIHIITFAEYWNCSWRSKKAAIFLVAINVILKVGYVIWTLPNFSNVRTIELFCSFIALLIYFYFIQIDKFKLLFTYILLIDYIIVIRGLSSFAGTRFFHSSFQSWPVILISFFLYALSLPWMLYFFQKTVHLVLQSDSPGLWRVIWMPPALTSVVVLLYTNAYESNLGDWKSLFARLSLMACILVVYYMLLRSLEELRSRAVLEEQTRQSEHILALQRTQYNRLQTYMEEIRRARHDLRQHQNIIRSFLEAGEDEKLRDYLQAQTSSLPADPFHSYCKNYAVNLLLNFYAGELTDKDIDFEFRINLPEELKIPTPNFCVILGNLLENAQDACIGQQEPFIRVAAQITANQAITLIVDNTSPTPPQLQEDGSFLSTKHSGSGIGTQSIRYIAKQYHGTADFRWENGMFLSSVFLNPPGDTVD